MNLLPEEADQLFQQLGSKTNWPEEVQVIIFPPAVYLQKFQTANYESIHLGIQNFFPKDSGAYTGEISLSQAESVGANIFLIGHSERRAYFGEHESFLKEKVDACVERQIPFVFCCGEPLSIRENGGELAFVKKQLVDSLFHLEAEQMAYATIAYEPVWAIGTGKTASSAQAEEMHQSIRNWIQEKYGDKIANSTSILYGGSCTPDNAKELFACPNVDGGLIGGASLKAASFIQITESF